jgi:hypothetical protein
MTKNRFLRFASVLTFFLALSFLLQGAAYHFLHIGFWERGILLNYLFNYGITLLLFVVLTWKMRQRPEYSGYLFLYGSFFKFLCFFLIIFPTLGAERSVRSPEFFSFIVPYAVCAYLEISTIIRQLNGK